MKIGKPVFRKLQSRRFDKHSQIKRLYLPVFMEQGLATLITMLGTVLVSSVSAEAVSGVGIVDSLNYMFMNALVAIGTGVMAVVSTCIGAGRKKEAVVAAQNAICLAIYASVFLGLVLFVFRNQLIGALFGSAEKAVTDSAIEYLKYTATSLPFLALFSVLSGIRRGTGDNMTPLISSIIANAVYIIVAVLCINALNMGVGGVGTGLFMSRVVSASVLAFYVFKKPRMLKLRKIPASPKLSELKMVLNIAIPSALDSIVFNGGKVLVQVFMAGMGTAAIAANTICSSLANFMQLPGKTTQITAVTLVGRSFGEGNYKKTRRIMLSQTVITMLAECVAVGLFILFFEPIIHLFTYDEEIISISKELMLILYIATPIFWAASFVTPQAIRATGDAKFTMIVSMISMVLCRVFGSWLLGVYFGMGMVGIWISMIFDWIFRSAFYIPRVFSKKWEI